MAFVVDCVGTDGTLALSAASVVPGGHLAVLGVGGGTLPFRFGVVPFETPVVFSNWGTRADLAEVVGLAQAGAIHIETERVTLEEVPAAYDRLEAGQVRGRVVSLSRDAGSHRGRLPDHSGVTAPASARCTSSAIWRVTSPHSACGRS